MSQGVLEIKSMYMEALYELQHWQERALAAEESVEAFMTGNIPENASLQTVIMATAGRKRLEALRNKPALLQGTLPE